MPGPELPGLVGASSIWDDVTGRIADLAVTSQYVLITGERGAGKLHVASVIGSVLGLSPAVFDTGQAAALGAANWLQKLEAALAEIEESIVILTRLERLELTGLDALADMVTGLPQRIVATAVAPDRHRSRQDRFGSLRLFTDRIHIPALRHRPEDVVPLARHFDRRDGAGALVWTAEALEEMKRYLWPGNVKELEHVVQGFIALSPTAEVHTELLPEELRRSVQRGPKTRLEEAEVDVMLDALTEAGGNKDVAAHLIGMHRATLYRKLQNYGLDSMPES
jgi:sigma-54 dependent transcriptional regulator, acetoin dehydrogenase operon transcriptional activator AcoR